MPRFPGFLLGGGTDGDGNAITLRPVLQVSVHIPHLHVRRPYPFLLDTGADQTSISPVLLNVPGERFGSSTTASIGIGGKARRWKIQGAALRITNGQELLDITPEPLFVVEGLKVNLLGRDALAQHSLAMFLDISSKQFYLER